MVLSSFKNSVKELEEALLNAAYHNVDISEKPTIFSLKRSKVNSYKTCVDRNLNFIKRKVWDLACLGSLEYNKPCLISLFNLVNDLDKAYKFNDVKEMIIIVDDVKRVLSKIKDVPMPKRINFSVSDLHPDIKDEVEADLKELSKCYASGCYRSVVMICGRILETVLHRKYYEITGNDALEKSPGIGLGKLIAKLNEKNVKFDPGLTQQIHLINQVRVFSVHKKQEPFYPTQMQAYAVTLFTLDSIRKIF